MTYEMAYNLTYSESMPQRANRLVELYGEIAKYDTEVHALRAQLRACSADRDRLREVLEMLLSYTLACEGLLNATESEQCKIARDLLQEAGDD